MKFADPFPFDRPVVATLPHGFTGNVEQLRADLAAMGLDVRSVEREDPPPAEGESRVTLTCGPGVAIAEAMRAMGDDFARLAGLDPHLPAMVHMRAAMRAATEDEARAARRRFERVMFGGCPCGEVTGDALCPWCDDDALPEGLRTSVAMMRRREAAGGKLDVEAVAKALMPKPQPVERGARPPNRHERRRAASRRWRG